jgi:hypothetical protein
VDESPEERRSRLNRERVQRHRDKKRQENRVKLELWPKAEHRQKIVDFAASLE